MLGFGKLKSGCEMLGVASQGCMLRVMFSGVHRNQVGHEIDRYLRDILTKQEPAGIVLDFLQFKYRSGNDIGGIMQAFVRKGSDERWAIRPCAIVAAGRTAKALDSLLRPTKFLEECGVRFFPDVSSGLDYVRARLALKTAKPCNPGQPTPKDEREEPTMQIDFMALSGSVLRVKCSGSFGIGSQGNPSGMLLLQSIRGWMAAHPGERVNQIDVDYSQVEYAGGDGPVSSMVPFIAQGVSKFRLIAGPQNRYALNNLVTFSRMPWFVVESRTG